MKVTVVFSLVAVVSALSLADGRLANVALKLTMLLAAVPALYLWKFFTAEELEKAATFLRRFGSRRG